MTGRLVFTYGTMAAGKSALVLQLAHQLRSCGQTVPLVTFGDRSGGGLITSRLGISADAIEMGPGDDITEAVRPVGRVAPRHLIVDEVQFATLAQVDAMAELVDTTGIDVQAVEGPTNPGVDTTDALIVVNAQGRYLVEGSRLAGATGDDPLVAELTAGSIDELEERIAS